MPASNAISETAGQIPRMIDLTPSEEQILQSITFDTNQFVLGHRFVEVLRESARNAKTLTLGLLERSAVPSIRWAYFTEARYNVGSKKSRAEVFESNGTCGEEIFGHAHFLNYLKYFIYGPDLPESTIFGFQKIVDDDRGTSGMIMDSLRKFVRSEVKRYHLDPKIAGEEFYKLALECGVSEHLARVVRDAAMQSR